jgi:hypothetical protein
MRMTVSNATMVAFQTTNGTCATDASFIMCLRYCLAATETSHSEPN